MLERVYMSKLLVCVFHDSSISKQLFQKELRNISWTDWDLLEKRSKALWKQSFELNNMKLGFLNIYLQIS